MASLSKSSTFIRTVSWLSDTLDETALEFDEDKIDRIVSDVRDEVHLNARRATQGKIRTGGWLNYEKKSAEQRYYNGERCWDWYGHV
jgi:hypothetical protein